MTEGAKPESIEPDEAAPALSLDKSDTVADSSTSKRRPVARGTSLRRPVTAAPSPGDHLDDADKAATAAASDAVDVEAPPVAPASPKSAVPVRRNESNRLPIAIGATAVTILVVAALVAWIRPWAAAVDNRAFVDTGLTTQVTSVAKQAAKEIYTIDMNDLGPWEKRLDAVLTPGMIAEAKKLRTAITQTAGALQDVKVKVDDGDLTAGVSLAREDHAEVLLNVRQQVSTQGVPFATMQSPMKFVLDRFDGTWKVSSITPL
ncbi:hypothetical protein [Tsukamurella ocularis]|uniref:hypothetical protein n=1 Tax=Tsukamurella ocularis TaxID=1970234 RepID=UPI002168A0AB|nr:hypothetical protein [Tsukamurella ocularis]MCS3781812.1 Mce-associated membrane protein [Tsukamurella ocularis]MCS3788306.1 Mce-associated membrane protein [Tsukamurella ocularis]MCS3852026.1 Mce-associated membrane protein [Tsukamurella ocularis]